MANEFAMRGDVGDIAVGIINGSAGARALLGIMRVLPVGHPDQSHALLVLQVTSQITQPNERLRP